MRSFLAAALFALFLTAPAFAAGGDGTAGFDRVLQSGTLRCGWATWAPFSFKDQATGQMSGIYVDIVEEMGRRLSLKIDWGEETPVAMYVEGLATGRYDMTCTALSIVAARARAMAYTQPVFYSPLYLAVPADDTRFDKDPSALNAPDMKIAIQDGEISDIVARQIFPRAQKSGIPQMAEYSQLFEDVANGKTDATIVVPSDLDNYMKTNPGKLKRVEPAVTYLALAFGTPKNDFALNSMVRDALTEMQTDGTVRRIFERYPGQLDYYLLPSGPETVRR